MESVVDETRMDPNVHLPARPERHQKPKRRQTATVTNDWNPTAADTPGMVEALTGCKRPLNHDSIGEIAGMTTTEIKRRLGITRLAAVRLQTALELGRRMTSVDLRDRSLLTEPGSVKEYLRRARGDGTQERTGALFLNARNRLLRDEPEIYKGTLDRAVVEPREILKRALLLNAAGIILYHNHPSGDPSPSREDREFTRRRGAATRSRRRRARELRVIPRSWTDLKGMER